jgi:hypothetical protein
MLSPMVRSWKLAVLCVTDADAPTALMLIVLKPCTV